MAIMHRVVQSTVLKLRIKGASFMCPEDKAPCPTLGLSGFILVARLAAWVGLSCPMDGLRRLLHGERDARAPRAPCFAKLFCYLCAFVVK